jgi:hypothetical protein
LAHLNSLLFAGRAAAAGGGVNVGGGMPGSSFINQLLSNFGAATQPPPRPQPATQQQQQQQQQQQPQQQRAQSAAMGAILREAMGLMDSNNPNDQRMNQPIRDFFHVFGADFDDDEGGDDENELGSHSAGSSNSALGVFNVFFSALSLGDMINMARGGGLNNPEVYQRARQPLRDHLRRACTNSSSTANGEDSRLPSQAQIDAFAQQLYTEMFEDAENGLQIDFSRFELIDQTIDLPRSVSKLVRLNFRILIEHIFDTQYDSSETPHMWSLIFNRKLHELIDQVVSLWRVCVRNADTVLGEMIMEKLRATMTTQNFMSVGGAFMGIFETFTRSQVQSLFGSVVPLPRRELQRFIAYRGQELVEDGGGSTSTAATARVEEPKEDKTAVSKAVETPVGNSVPQQQVSSLEVDAYADDQYDSASSTLSSHSMDIDQHFNEAMEQMLKRKKNVSLFCCCCKELTSNC